MAGASSFLAILRIAGFFTAVWSVGKLAKFIGVSSIVFEMGIGLLLSPSLLGLMPPPYAECTFKNEFNSPYRKALYDCSSEAAEAAVLDEQHELRSLMEQRKEHSYGYCGDESKAYFALDGASTIGDLVEGAELDAYTACMSTECVAELTYLCGTEPDFFTLIGHTGVSMMIFESGMHFDFDKAKIVGPKACVVAVFGTFLPIIAAIIIMTYIFQYDLKYGIAAGVSLAPTSVGIALKLLLEAKRLQEDFGQAIITAAFVDDILSIVIFNIFFTSASGKFTFMGAIFPALIGMVFMVVGAGLGISFWPWMVENVLARVPPKKGISSLSRQDECMFLIMFVLLALYGAFTNFLGTHLWGCFIAGMSFAKIHHAHHVWVRQVKRITVWMLRIFFSCTVAFAIPWQGLFNLNSFVRGSVLGIFACIGTKVFCAFFMGEARWVIGWAMVGRAEFAYYIAGLAKSASPPLLDDESFSVVIWSLLYATIFAPFMFRKVLSKYSIRLAAKEASEGDVAKVHSTNSLGRGSVRDGDMSRSMSQSVPMESRTITMSRHSVGHTIMDGSRWGTNEELTAFRFQIVYPKGTQSCSVEDLAEIWQLLRKVGLYVTHMSQQCDKDTHFSDFTVQAEDGRELQEKELSFVQQALFEELKGVGAHLIFLPAMRALQSVCKLAKVTVIGDALTHEGRTSMQHMYGIVSAVVAKSFYILRGAVHLHGQSLVVELLIGHTRGLETDGEDKAETAEAPSSVAEISGSHVHLGARTLPDIGPEELDELKVRLDQAIPGRISTIVDPLTYAHGPLGGMQYDFKTLISTQMEELPACEIRFQFASFPHEALTGLMNVLDQEAGITLISATFDERQTECQMNVVIAKEDLSQAFEDSLLSKLAALASKMALSGSIDLANLNNPMQKRFVTVGVDNEIMLGSDMSPKLRSRTRSISDDKSPAAGKDKLEPISPKPAPVTVTVKNDVENQQVPEPVKEIITEGMSL
eukprot:TRINITY_DN105_c0_g5_i1.p1 TRINITY_DN105_c0_g5~~TRINITY_DN105_c0_g5_i1.p1  ORF type:complete len:981 (-),score=261.70 TRINITY_DN105_c0_g5_i1:347-3289(-)